MVTTKDIMDYYKDEEIALEVVLQDSQGQPIPTTGLTVSMVASSTPRGANVWDSPRAFTLEDAGTSTWTRVLDPVADLDVFAEGVASYYAIWSQETGQAPVLRVTGQLKLNESISLSGAE